MSFHRKCVIVFPYNIYTHIYIFFLTTNRKKGGLYCCFIMFFFRFPILPSLYVSSFIIRLFLRSQTAIRTVSYTPDPVRDPIKWRSDSFGNCHKQRCLFFFVGGKKQYMNRSFNFYFKYKVYIVKNNGKMRMRPSMPM